MLDSLLSGRILRVQQLLEATVYHPKRPIIIPNVRLSSHTSSIIIPNVRLSSQTSDYHPIRPRLSSQTSDYHPKRTVITPYVRLSSQNVRLSSQTSHLSSQNVQLSSQTSHYHPQMSDYPYQTSGWRETCVICIGGHAIHYSVMAIYSSNLFCIQHRKFEICGGMISQGFPWQNSWGPQLAVFWCSVL